MCQNSEHRLNFIVYSTNYREGVLEWEGLEVTAFRRILLLEKEINRRGASKPYLASERKQEKEKDPAQWEKTNLSPSITNSINCTSLSW